MEERRVVRSRYSIGASEKFGNVIHDILKEDIKKRGREGEREREN